MSKSLSRRILALPLLAALFAAPAAMAEDAPRGRPYVFTTVDDYSIRLDGRIDVTGVLQGEAEPRTVTFKIVLSHGAQESLQTLASRCDRMALLAMSKPGAYLLTMSVEDHPNNYIQFACKLARVP
ncbi:MULTISPECIES: hypothetical protein [Myxococcus]|nr:MULTISPECIES: hypothetical protein [Myxococcus]QZZ53981.1 hypothetical protein MyxoNM_32635 [Myxococcus xanthus]UYI13636.1 hypothetical protein N3T43_32005 [Myxococcus xanthus]UYI21002.1 hypothetical protein N1129_32455 [Myxococcus xanthus]SDW29749.1 hypothetical protein SAMN05444383_101969 [Myxococcus xanthus]